MAKRTAWTTLTLPRETVVEMVGDHVKGMLNKDVQLGNVEVKRSGAIEVTFKDVEVEPALPLGEGEAGRATTGDS